MNETNEKINKKWFMVIPAAAAAWGSVHLLLFFLVNAPFYSDFMEATYGSLLVVMVEFVFFAVAPYWGVVFGGKVAPKGKFLVAIMLSVLFVVVHFGFVSAGFITTVTDPMWIILGFVVMLVAVTLASIQTRRGSTPLD